jgi:hypothetical protein
LPTLSIQLKSIIAGIKIDFLCVLKWMQCNAMVYKIGYIERRCMNCCDVGALYISWN